MVEVYWTDGTGELRGAKIKGPYANAQAVGMLMGLRKDKRNTALYGVADGQQFTCDEFGDPIEVEQLA